MYHYSKNQKIGLALVIFPIPFSCFILFVLPWIVLLLTMALSGMLGVDASSTVPGEVMEWVFKIFGVLGLMSFVIGIPLGLVLLMQTKRRK